MRKTSRGMAEYHVVLEEQPEGGFTVQCVEVPGAISQGETEDEALENIKDAIRGILEVRRAKARSSLGPGSSVRTVDVDA